MRAPIFSFRAEASEEPVEASRSTCVHHGSVPYEVALRITVLLERRFARVRLIPCQLHGLGTPICKGVTATICSASDAGADPSAWLED